MPDGTAPEAAPAESDAVLRELIRLSQEQYAALCRGDIERVRVLMEARADLLRAWGPGHRARSDGLSQTTGELQRALESADATLARELEARLGAKAEELRQVRRARRVLRNYSGPGRAGPGQILDHSG